MVRSAEDKTAAVAAARDVFWTKGYDETSVEDLVAATGFNRYALYSLFEGKLNLFLAVLDEYQKERRDLFCELLSDETRPPMQAIEHVFEFCAGQMAERGVGCLLGNVAYIVARTEPLIAERIKTHFDEIAWAHTEALKRAQDRGELNPAITPEGGARLLVTLILGLGAGAENVNSHEDSRASFKTALAALSAPITKASAKATTRNVKKSPTHSEPCPPAQRKASR